MSKGLKNLFLYLLTFNILLSSVGVTLHRRSCSMPNMEDALAFFVKPADCCEIAHKDNCHSEPEDNLHKPINPCCNFTADLIKVDYESPVYASLTFDFAALFILSNKTEIFAPIAALCNHKKTYFYTDSSPPLSSREILLRKQSLLI